MALYQIDPLHSEVEFKVKHLMISTVKGNFTQYSATLESENDDFTNAKIMFEAAIASINTGNEQRDGHLKSAEFFDAEQFPTLNFVSTAFTKTGDDTYALHGNMTIKGITQPLSLQVTYGGTMVDFYGQTKLGFDVTGVLSRKAFGLTWNGVTEAGGVVLADDIKLNLSIQLTKQA